VGDLSRLSKGYSQGERKKTTGKRGITGSEEGPRKNTQLTFGGGKRRVLREKGFGGKENFKNGSLQLCMFHQKRTST